MDSPDVIHGRMKEGAHIAGYSLQRAMENLRWLLEDSRYEQLASGYRNVNDFLRDTQDAFRLLNINPEERKQIAELVKELQPKASQRAIGELMGVSVDTVARDLGYEPPVRNQTKTLKETPDIVRFQTPPALPPDDYDPIKDERKRQEIKDKQLKKAEQARDYTEQVKEKPILEKSYHVIYADPPWQYSENVNILDAVSDHHYNTLPIEKICSFLEDMRIRTTDNAVLFLWVTNPFLEKALSVVKAWGFSYKTNIVWRKTELQKPGVGYYVRGRHELLFICTKGSFTPLNKNISPPISSVLDAPVSVHSAKPQEVYTIIERLYPDCTYLELFARNKHDGWDAIGDEIE